MDRLTAYRKQLFSLLPAGLALRHNGNPAASLRIDKIYCLPVLLSGLATLVLTNVEVQMINKFHKNILVHGMIHIALRYSLKHYESGWFHYRP